MTYTASPMPVVLLPKPNESEILAGSLKLTHIFSPRMVSNSWSRCSHTAPEPSASPLPLCFLWRTVKLSASTTRLDTPHSPKENKGLLAVNRKSIFVWDQFTEGPRGRQMYKRDVASLYAEVVGVTPAGRKQCLIRMLGKVVSSLSRCHLPLTHSLLRLVSPRRGSAGVTVMTGVNLTPLNVLAATQLIASSEHFAPAGGNYAQHGAAKTITAQSVEPLD
ncbi:hypothetical protein MHYP_G00118480 [Metynnis hypsauchen]